MQCLGVDAIFGCGWVHCWGVEKQCLSVDVMLGIDAMFG